MTTIGSPITNERPTPDDTGKANIPYMIHQLAQPLTLLTGILDLCTSPEVTPGEFRMWIEQAKEQVARVNAGFSQIRKAVNTQTH